MRRFIDGEDRQQPALLPHSLEDYVSEENPVRVIEVFIDELDLAALGFSGMTPAATGRQRTFCSTRSKFTLPSPFTATFAGCEPDLLSWHKGTDARLSQSGGEAGNFASLLQVDFAHLRMSVVESQAALC
jgi:hypothetical protein